MRSLMLVAARVSLFSLVLVVLAACYVPPVWDAFDAINHVSDLEAGKSTRSQVLGLLGDPEGDPDGSALFYTGKHSHGVWFIGSYGGGAGGLIAEEYWWVTIYFDEKDVVQATCTSEDDSDKRHICAREAKERREQQQRDFREKLNDQMWRAECGDAEAQFQVGTSYQYGVGGVSEDRIPAARWLSLASGQGHELAAARLTQVRKDMTPEEIAEAERLVAEWKPDPARCGLDVDEATK